MQAQRQWRQKRRISIHSLRVEGDTKKFFDMFERGISIHSLRVEGDCPPIAKNFSHFKISIHSLRVEGDQTVKHSIVQG